MNSTEYEEQIDNWMPLIKKLAARYNNTIAGFDDLVQEGILALIEGLNSYDSNDHGHINGYLRNIILRKIYSMAINSSFAVHVPSGSMKLLEKQEGMIKSLKGFHVCLYDHADEPSYKDSNAEILDIKNLITEYDRDGIARMYFFEGLNYQEISLRTGVSLATISRHINLIRGLVAEKCEM